MSNPTTFAARLKALRLAGGLSTHELARRSGVLQANISRYETSARKPSWDAVQKLAAALGVTPNDFCGKNGRK